MIPGRFDIVGNLIFVGKHSIHVHVSGAGDQIFLIRIFARQLIGNQMAPVVEIIAVDAFILDCMPAGRLDAANGTSWSIRKQIRAEAGDSVSASPLVVQT